MILSAYSGRECKSNHGTLDIQMTSTKKYYVIQQAINLDMSSRIPPPTGSDVYGTFATHPLPLIDTSDFPMISTVD